MYVYAAAKFSLNMVLRPSSDAFCESKLYNTQKSTNISIVEKNCITIALPSLMVYIILKSEGNKFKSKCLKVSRHKI